MKRVSLVARIGIALVGLSAILAPQALWFTQNGLLIQSHNLNRFEKMCEALAPLDVAAFPQNQTTFFTDVTNSMKLDFHHVVGPVGTYFLPEINGAGGALWDYDGDGDLDIYLINSGRSPHATGDFSPGTRTENRLFRQEQDRTFTDVTRESGLGDKGYGTGCAIGDIDNDGDLDVYVTNHGADRLYRNNGNGTFTDITEPAGIHNPDYATCAAFLDYDRDGRLDLVVANYVSDPLHGLSVACSDFHDGVTYCGPKMFVPTADRLFHNQGTSLDEHGERVTIFSDETESSGMSEVYGAAFGIVCADFNRDRWPDIYISNDTAPNRLWINQGNGVFREEGLIRGAAVNGKGREEAGMGVAIGDVNGNGFFDLLSAHLTQETHTLYLNDGTGMFRDATVSSLLAETTLPHTGWGAAFLDLDHDGDLDLALANGLVISCHLMTPTFGVPRFEVRQDSVPDPEAYWRNYFDRNLLFMNDGTGQFEDVSHMGGDFTSQAGSARALIYGDIDNDGDQDLLVTYCGNTARLYRNDIPKRGHWLRIRAFDPRLKRDAYGAEVIVTTKDRQFIRIVHPTSSYLASHDIRCHFGLGDADQYDHITVRWPDGLTEEFPSGVVDCQILLTRGEGKSVVKGSL